MNLRIRSDKKRNPPQKNALPPAGLKILDAFTTLLKKKEFSTITNAEISKVSGVNETLIYRYFGSKRELLHTVLFYLVDDFNEAISRDLGGIKGSLNKLRKLIWAHISLYQNNLVFAKILILEVRSSPGYFQSVTYKSAVKKYTKLIRDIIEEGKKNGEIREDVSSWMIMQILLAAIEHLSMPKLLFQKSLSADELTDEFCTVLFDGIRKQRT